MTTPLEIVADFYDAGQDWTQWSTALSSLGTHVGAEISILATHDYQAGQGAIERAVGLSPESRVAYMTDFSRQNVWLQDEQHFTSAPAVLRAETIVPAERLRSTAFYQHWLAPAGITNAVFVVLDRREDRIVFLALMNQGSGDGFSEAAVAQLRELAPVLRRALFAGKRFQNATKLKRLSIDVLNGLPLGVAFIDGRGHVVESNRRAKAAFEGGDAFVGVNGELFVCLESGRIKLADMVASAVEPRRLSEARPEILSVPRRTGMRPLTLMLVPAPNEIGEATNGDPVAMLFIGDPDQPTEFDHQRIAKLYGLSRAESRVAALVASGYRLDEAAEQLDVAYETVRKHIKQIFGKTGTYRQAELVRMMVTGPAGLSL